MGVRHRYGYLGSGILGALTSNISDIPDRLSSADGELT